MSAITKHLLIIVLKIRIISVINVIKNKKNKRIKVDENH